MRTSPHLPVDCLALHGFTGCGADFRALQQEQALSHFRWSCPDLPGHGNSGAKTADPRAMLDAIEKAGAAIWKEGTGQSRVLLGYSMGARAALAHMVHRPSAWDGLVLISGTAGLSSSQQRAERKLADEDLANQMEAHGLEWFLDRWSQKPIIRSQQKAPPEIREMLKAHREKQTVAGLSASLRSFGTGVFPSLWGQLGKVRCPTLLVTGQNDPKFTGIAELMIQALPYARHCIIEDTGHAPHFEAPSQVAKVLGEWSKELPKSP